MDDKQIDDLKQFITSIVSNTVSESEKRLHINLRKDLGKDIQNLRKDTMAGFAGVGDAIEVLIEHIDKQLDNHEVRITRLEKARLA